MPTTCITSRWEEIEYLKHLGVKVDLNTIQNESKVVLVRNEIDYRSPARFDELLDIYTRVSSLRRTSFAFEGIIEEAVTKRLVAENIAIHVWLHPSSGEPILVNHAFKEAAYRFEQNDVVVMEQPSKT